MYGDEQLKIMAILNSGKTFANGEQLTADKLNQVIEEASFNTNNAVDGSSTTVIGTAISVRDGGISPSKLSSGGPSWRSSDGALRVGTESDDSSRPLAFVKGRRQSTRDTLELNANDDIELTTNSSITGASDNNKRMVVKGNSGMVGINQTSPVGTLHITDIGDTRPTVFLEGANANEGDIAVSHTEALQIGHWNKNNNSFTERMTFHNNGNVGIGESSPSTKLEVGGNFKVRSTAAEFNHIQLENSSEVFAFIGGRNGDLYINAGGTKDKLRLATNGSDRLLIQQNGNVGINTTSPDEKLDVNGNIQLNGNLKEAVNNNLLRVQGGHDNSGASQGAHLDLYGGTHSDHPSLAILDADEHRFRAQDGSPDYLKINRGGGLTITKAGTDQHITSFNTTQGSSTRGLHIKTPIDSNHNSPFRFQTGNSISFEIDSTEAMRVAADGKILVGQTTSPTSVAKSLFVNGRIGSLNTYSQTTSSSANLFIGSSGLFQRSTSSARYKQNIQDYDKGIDAIKSLRPVYFESINEDDDHTYAGFIAEEVHDANLTEFVNYNEEGQPDALHYSNMVAVLTKALQESLVKIESLEARVASLES